MLKNEKSSATLKSYNNKNIKKYNQRKREILHQICGTCVGSEAAGDPWEVFFNNTWYFCDKHLALCTAKSLASHVKPSATIKASYVEPSIIVTGSYVGPPITFKALYRGPLTIFRASSKALMVPTFFYSGVSFSELTPPLVLHLKKLDSEVSAYNTAHGFLLR